MADFYSQEIANAPASNTDFYSKEIAPQQATNDFYSKEIAGSANSDLNNLMPVTNDQITPKDQLNFGDYAKLSFLDDSNKLKYLKTKYTYAEPNQDGEIMYGNDPNNLQKVHPDEISQNFFNRLGGIVGDLPSIAGQIALTAAAPEAGIPMMLARAGVGAALGQAGKDAAGVALFKNNPDIAKGATDVAIAGAFGAAGQAIGEALKGGSQMVMAKAGKALDQYRDGLILEGKDPSRIDQWTAKALHIATGEKESTILTGQKLGWDNIFASKEAVNPSGIDSIAQDVIDNVSKTTKQLGENVDTATKGLINDTKGKVVDTAPILSRLFQDLNELGILDITKSPANPLGGAVINKNSPLNKNFFTSFISELGGKEVNLGGGYKSFVIDPETKISVADSLRIKRGFQAAINSDSRLSSVEANVAKRALYGNLEEGVSGISDQLNKIAQKIGNDRFINANQAFSDFTEHISNLKKSGLDLNNPVAARNFLSRINDANPTVLNQLSTLDNKLGNNFVQRAQMWNVNNDIIKLNPNLLRLGAVSTLMGGGTGLKLGGALALGTPSGLKTVLKTPLGGTRAIGRGIINTANNVNKAASNKKGIAVISQLLKNSGNKN